MKKFRLGYFHKQLIAVVGVNILALLIMSGLLYSNFLVNYKDNLIEELDSKLTLLAATSTSALLFEDRQAANSLLSSMEQYTAARYAQIYDVNMQLFAEYKRPGLKTTLHINEYQEVAFFKGQNIYKSQRIMMAGDFLGVIVISADTNSLNEQKKEYLLIATWVFLGSIILAYVLNWRLQKRLKTPISDLINIVGYVAKNKRYHKRINNNRTDEIGNLMYGVNTMLDTIEKHELQLYKRANYDELTQLPNRHLLMERMSHCIKVATRNRTEIAVLFFDLDRFKVINDSLGHHVGDELLFEVAATLVSTMRETDSICRWGGDEFVMVLEDIKNTKDIQKIVDKILVNLNKPTTLNGHILHISTSIGIARFPLDGEDADTLLKHADISMYKAKSEGLGQYRYFTPTMLDDSVQRLTFETQVRSAFKEKEFYMVYQPKMSADGTDIDGFEALIRWKFEGNFVSPEKFLTVIEEVGLMQELSTWVLEETCRQNIIWQEQGLKPVSIAINLPASFIVHPKCLEVIQASLRNSGLSPEYLEIELTENTFIGSKIVAVPILECLRKLGVNIAIDDFGTGYSCLSYLQDLPIGTLKIDGSFIKDLSKSQANKGIVESIITLGKSLGMTIVAECVETEEQLSILQSMDCDVIQGYYFSKPLTVKDATLFLEDF